MIVNRNIFTKLQLNKEIKPWWAEIQKHLYQLQTFERQCLYIHDYYFHVYLLLYICVHYLCEWKDKNDVQYHSSLLDGPKAVDKNVHTILNRNT